MSAWLWAYDGVLAVAGVGVWVYLAYCVGWLLRRPAGRV